MFWDVLGFVSPLFDDVLACLVGLVSTRLSRRAPAVGLPPAMDLGWVWIGCLHVFGVPFPCRALTRPTCLCREGTDHQLINTN